jgi:hypothetical protein
VTKYSFAELPQWVSQTEKVIDAVFSQATNDMINSADIVPGINRGGSRIKGTIPRDLGPLAASLQSSLNGGTAIGGATGWTLIAGNLKAGDFARFAWGGNIAPYAADVHYGSNGVPGTYWIDIMANGWSTKWVPRAVRKARSELG